MPLSVGQKSALQQWGRWVPVGTTGTFSNIRTVSTFKASRLRSAGVRGAEGAVGQGRHAGAASVPMAQQEIALDHLVQAEFAPQGLELAAHQVGLRLMTRLLPLKPALA